MRNFKVKFRLLTLIGVILISACGREVTECGGNTLNTQKLLSLKDTSFSNGPKAFLVVPNPIDATQIPSVQATDSRVLSAIDPFFLPDLLSVQKLENNFLKVRIKDINDSPSLLASPNAKGEYAYELDDVHYSETMAYHSISSILQYVEALGFSTVKTRPLYVMVRTQVEGQDPSAINALYSHNYLNPNLPRTMQLFGNTAYSPGQDRDIYWHEFGHYFNESISAERGIDFAGDSGALFSEGAALHEALADYLAESVSNKAFIGRWIARNFKEIPVGEPLRSAEPKRDDLNDFSSVSLFDNSGKNLDRYRMAQWLTRVLWDLRSQFVKEDEKTGALYADRLVFSAVSLLKRDTSIREFKDSLSKADSQLHCGLHSRSIDSAFESRGFKSKVDTLSTPLTLKATPVSLDNQGFGFETRITNNGSGIARNVRMILESPDGSFQPVVYQQAYGDLAAGRSITIGKSGPLPLDYSVQGTTGTTSGRGRARFRLRLKIENGPDTVQEGNIN